MADPHTSRLRSSPVGPTLIAGAAFGGLVLLCVLVGLLFPYLRRRSRRHAQRMQAQYKPTPFQGKLPPNELPQARGRTSPHRPYPNPRSQPGLGEEASRPLLRGPPSVDLTGPRAPMPGYLPRRAYGSPTTPPTRPYHSHFQSDSLSSTSSKEQEPQPVSSPRQPYIRPRSRGPLEAYGQLQLSIPPPKGPASSYQGSTGTTRHLAPPSASAAYPPPSSAYPYTASPYSPPLPNPYLSPPPQSHSSLQPLVVTQPRPRSPPRPAHLSAPTHPFAAIEPARPSPTNTIDSILSDYSQESWDMVTTSPPGTSPSTQPNKLDTASPTLSPSEMRRLVGMPDVPTSVSTPVSPLSPTAYSPSSISFGRFTTREDDDDDDDDGLRTPTQANPRPAETAAALVRAPLTDAFRADTKSPTRARSATSTKSANSAYSAIAPPTPRVQKSRAPSREAGRGHVEGLLSSHPSFVASSSAPPPVPTLAAPPPAALRPETSSASPVVSTAGPTDQPLHPVLLTPGVPPSQAYQPPPGRSKSASAAASGSGAARSEGGPRPSLRPKRSVTFTAGSGSEPARPPVPLLPAHVVAAGDAGPSSAAQVESPGAPATGSSSLSSSPPAGVGASSPAASPTPDPSTRAKLPAFPTAPTSRAKPPARGPSASGGSSTPARAARPRLAASTEPLPPAYSKYPTSPTPSRPLPTPTSPAYSSSGLSSVSSVIPMRALPTPRGSPLPAPPGSARRALPSLPSSPAQNVGAERRLREERERATGQV